MQACWASRDTHPVVVAPHHVPHSSAAQRPERCAAQAAHATEAAALLRPGVVVGAGACPVARSIACTHEHGQMRSEGRCSYCSAPSCRSVVHAEHAGLHAGW